MNEIIKKLVSFGDRQGDGVFNAYKYLVELLKERNIKFRTEVYKVDLPIWNKSILKADRVVIPSLPTGLSSGTIKDSSVITTSLISSKHFLDTPHINFNPKTKKISRANFSFAPSFAVSRNYISKICNANKIEGKLEVIRTKQNTYQIMIGNTKNPKNIIFSHFDSIGTGAIDNASGTAVMLEAIVSNQRLLTDNLFVFDGNEEISYDYPIYWGKGYRNFEGKYAKQIANANRLIVVDCIGYDITTVLSGPSDRHIIKLAFPIKNIDKYSDKIKLITSDYDKLMNVYHSDLDQPELIKEKYLKEALRVLNKQII